MGEDWKTDPKASKKSTIPNWIQFFENFYILAKSTVLIFGTASYLKTLCPCLKCRSILRYS
ncbi:hypothetical protein LEP1GSC040_1866 [Leptospira santarosai str. 2000030832]|nr:hypothetical protein LEP1GSC040_1866 [Leptospira santarosai str. 2000030832]